MNEEIFLDFARRFMSLPTASYHEHFAAQAVEAFVAERPEITCSSDPCGNLLLLYNGCPSPSPRRPYLIATAHLDHPGLAYSASVSKSEFAFEMLGGFKLDLALGSRVSIFHLDSPAEQTPVRGKVTAYRPPQGRRPPALIIAVPPPAASQIGPGSFAMWDLPPFKKKGRLLTGRACDDLAGVAVGLTFLHELVRLREPVRAGLLLTRAEEIGFGGMLAAVRGKSLKARNIYINIECSSLKAGASLGAGPVIRLGDRWSVFDPHIAGGMVAIAEDLKANRADFKFQRKLMDGGICEATVLMNAGLQTGAVALPLKNYHNSGKKRFKPEAVHLDDALGLVDLLIHMATIPGGLTTAQRAAARDLDKEMSKRHRKSAARLTRSAQKTR